MFHWGRVILGNSTDRKTSIISKLPVLLGVLFFLIVFFPGSYSADTVLLLQQAKGMVPDTNWHTPVLREIWSVLSINGRYPVNIFIFQTAIFAVSIVLYLRVANEKSKYLVYFAFINPITFNIVGFVSKDTFIFLGIIFLYGAYINLQENSTDEKYFWLIFGITIIASFRINVIIIFIPLLHWITCHLKRNSKLSSFSKARVTLTVLIGVLLISNTANWAFSGRELSPQGVISLWDLAGISSRTNTMVIPNEYLNDCPLEKLKYQYSTRISDQLFWGPESCFSTTLPEEYEEQLKNRREIGSYSTILPISTWLQGIIKYPTEYLRHRLDVGSNLLGIVNPPTGQVLKGLTPSVETVGLNPKFENDFNFVYWEMILNLKLVDFLFLPAVWIFLLMIISSNGKKNQKDVFRISLLFVISMVLLTPGTDLRYTYPLWGLIVVSIGLVGYRSVKI